MRRYDIVKGNTTTAGGIAQAGDGKDLIGNCPHYDKRREDDDANESRRASLQPKA